MRNSYALPLHADVNLLADCRMVQKQLPSPQVLWYVFAPTYPAQFHELHKVCSEGLLCNCQIAFSGGVKLLIGCRMIQKRPEEAFGPFIDWREYSLLNNSKLPAEDKAQAVQVHVCQVSPTCKELHTTITAAQNGSDWLMRPAAEQ